MHDTASLIIAIMGAILTWTVTIASLVYWLTSKFRFLEGIIYREMDKHRREDDALFKNQGTRIQKLELKAFGFTKHP